VHKQTPPGALAPAGPADAPGSLFGGWVADYSKKSFEEGTNAFEQLFGAQSVEKAMELQQVYFKNAYEGFVTQATKIGALYADLVKDTC
jgi:hypothetical protein